MDDFKESLYDSMNKSDIAIVRDRDPRYTAAELGVLFAAVMAMFNAFALQLLLTVYIMFEKVEVNMFTGATMGEIEKQVKGYISLKTALSFLTGMIVAIILLLLQVKLAVMFGILSFVLNYIPNIGSMIAMFLPIPIVIVDPNLEQWQKIGAFVGPGAVQAYVGNALEPMMFGKSLNMTPMSILAALVIWGSVWGIVGAILSVPMLAIQKILLTKANHPLAKTVLGMIREDPTIDENDPGNEEAKASQKSGSAERDAWEGSTPPAGAKAAKGRGEYSNGATSLLGSVELSSVDVSAANGAEQDHMVNPLQQVDMVDAFKSADSAGPPKDEDDV